MFIIIIIIIIISLLKLQWLVDSPVVVVLEASACTFVCNLCCGKMYRRKSIEVMLTTYLIHN